MHVCLGWHSPALVLFSLSLSLALASAASLVGVVMGKLNPRTLIPLGPYLLIGFLVVSYSPVSAVITGEALVIGSTAKQLVELLEAQCVAVDIP